MVELVNRTGTWASSSATAASRAALDLCKLPCKAPLTSGLRCINHIIDGLDIFCSALGEFNRITTSIKTV